MTTEPLPEAAQPENLTSALRRSGVLTDERVTDVAVENARATVLSKIIRLRLNYDRPAKRCRNPSTASALWQIATPVFQAGANIPTVIWWNNFERILMAVDDLGCRELLG